MARLTNRPSIAYSAASRYPSATPDPAYDQENMDPDGPRDKGKQRASDYPPAQARLPTPQSRDDTTPVRSQKRKRATIPPASVEKEHNMSGDTRFTKDYDPHQDPEERREVKRKQRELVQNFHDHRDELLRDDGTLLQETVETADQIFGQVKNTSDAVPDARLLVSIGQLAYKKSDDLVNGDHSLGLDVDEFFAKCLSYMRNGGTAASPAPQRRPAATQAADDSDDEDVRPLDWDLLGRRACIPFNSRPPVPSFLLGPLSREKKQRAQTQRRARQQANTALVTRPEALTQVEHEQAEQNSVTAQCNRLNSALKKHIKSAKRAYLSQGYNAADLKAGVGAEIFAQQDIKVVKGGKLVDGAEHETLAVPLLKWIINPHSFSQTVENLFYVSFLIKEGSAGLAFDEDGLPMIYTEEGHSVEEQRKEQITKQQAVLSLDYEVWKDLIEAYDIQEPLIEHRETSQATQMTNGWYAS